MTMIKYPKNFHTQTKETKKDGVRQLTVKAFQKTSVHCFPNISSSDAFNLVRLVWILLSVSSWALFSYQTYGMLTTYGQYGVTSSYSVHIDKQLIFPGKFH